MNGTVGDLQAFLNLCSGTRPHSQPILFLPVFFANLDPAGIPAAGELEFISAELGTRVARAIVSLRALVNGDTFQLPTAASLDLWPRVWEWIHFMNTYRDVLPNSSDRETYTVFVSLIIRLRLHRETRDLIDATSGVRVVIARAWAVFVFEDCFRTDGFRHVCRSMLSDLKTSNPANFAEVVEGAGGNSLALASLIIQYITCVVAMSDPLTVDDFLTGVIAILDETEWNPAFKKILLSAGIVTAITSIVSFLAGATVDGTALLLNDCFTLLSRIFTTYAAPMCIPDALCAGLLPAICVCSAAHSALHEHMQHLLREVLPGAMVYHSVLTCIATALAGLDESVRDPRFARSDLFKHWTKLLRLAYERVAVVRAYDEGEYRRRKACDNPECGDICDKKSIKRCASCQRLHYCSIECQTFHWQQGGHRVACRTLRDLRIRESESLTTRDRSFMHALAHHDYRLAQQRIFFDEIEFLRECPDEPYYLQFDYTRGAVEIELLPIGAVDVSPTPSNFEVQWVDHVARAATSAGRMRVCIMRFVQDSRACYRMISMHSSSSDVRDGLRRIAKGIPADAEYDAIRPGLLNDVRALAPLDDISM
ncbi:hypothetical protein DFH07DRAFT_972766 [Mycena maculata]|uniref:MYND-type domain-containing protein n=1 Tax=Mycena maculata TaxID=230809 RepID=A0AAD7HG54_9AGAR|nr:hypothetical protein DFH07DRAFT_972766 [Mycena maculata]